MLVWHLLNSKTGVSVRAKKTPRDAIIGRAMGAFSQIKEASVFAFNMPSIPELGQSTGFDLITRSAAVWGMTN